MDTATINDELAPYVKGINELEMVLTEAAYHGVEIDTVQAFIEENGFNADEIYMESAYDLFSEWANTSCLEVVAISRRSFSVESDETTVSAVEFLLAYGGPSVRLTVPLDGSNIAPVAMNWWSDSATEIVITATLAEMVEQYIDIF